MTKENGSAVSMTVRTVTPRMCRGYLAEMRPNRAKKHRNHGKMVAAMKAGRWRLDGSCLRFNKDGKLIDGQHRCIACIEADTPFKTYVITGLDEEEVMESIDTGSARTPADFLAIKGYKNAAFLAGLTLTADIVLSAQGLRTEFYKLRCVNAIRDRHVLLDWLIENPVLEETATHFVSVSRSLTGICPPSLAVGVFAAIAMAVDKDWAFDFGEKVCTGEGLKKGDPIAKLRRVFHDVALKPGATLTKKARINLILKTWAYWFTETELQTRLQSKSRANEIPEIATLETNAHKLQYHRYAARQAKEKAREAGRPTLLQARRARGSKKKDG